MTYVLNAPELDAAVGGAAPHARHVTLLRALSNTAAFPRPRLATTRGGYWLDQRQVRTAAGDLVHDDHRVWLAEQLAADGGDAPATMRRLAALDLRLTHCAMTVLYLTSDQGGPQESFLQATVRLEDETLDRRAFNMPAVGFWTEPRDLYGLREAAEAGPALADGERRRVRPSAYRFERAIDVAGFLATGQAVHRERVDRQRRRTLTMTTQEGATHLVTGADLDPDGDLYQWPERRMMDDWTLSSAGRSGARLCEHWVLQTVDHTDTGGRRWMSFVPVWTFGGRLAEIARMPRSDYELFGQLEAMDQRLGVPWGWYFYMLHGNRVHDWAGHRVLAAAEAGKIVLPEHDWQVLRRWAARIYGF